MAHFVLVPGAWLGAWAWERVVALLEAAGHSAHGVTLSGLAERAGEVPMAAIDLDTHARDIIAAARTAPAADVILVSHSYSGLPVLQAADALVEGLAGVVHVDSAVAESGTAMFGGDWARERRAQLERTGVWAPEVQQFEEQGLSDEDLARLRERSTPHPGGTLTQPLHLTRALSSVPTTYLHCLGDSPEMDPDTFALTQRHGWRLEHIDTGHWPMLSAPELLVGHLISAAD